jgi:hypothetical protein
MLRVRVAGFALAAAVASAGAASAQVAKVGDTMKYTFQQSLMNGQGVKSLADLAGRPVLFDFWGVH